MTDINIPPEALAAGYAAWWKSITAGAMTESALAAAIRAALKAWSGASRESDQLGGNCHRIILPLTENPNG
jgi:hypothetical protein